MLTTTHQEIECVFCRGSTSKHLGADYPPWPPVKAAWINAVYEVMVILEAITHAQGSMPARRRSVFVLVAAASPVTKMPLTQSDT